MANNLDEFDPPEQQQPQFRVQIPGDPRRVISVRQHNPGNIKDSPRDPFSLGAGTRGFAIYRNPEEGFMALQSLIDRYYKGMTLEQMAYKYAPPYENDTEAWIRNVGGRLGIPRQTPVAQVPTFQLAAAIIPQESSAQIEGGPMPKRNIDLSEFDPPENLQKPAPQNWQVKASEVPGLTEAVSKKPAQPQAVMPEAPGIVAAINRWRNRPLPTPEEKEKAINEMADSPGWQRRLLFTAIRNIKGFNPGGILREKGIEELEDVLQKAEQKATGSGYGMVSQAIPWAAGAAPLWEAGAGVAQSVLRNIPKVGTIARAAEELPGIFKRGVGIIPKVKGAAARAVTGAVTIPAMDVARGKMPGPWDVAMGAGFGAVLGPGAFRLGVPPPKPGTAAASEEVAQQYKNVEEEVAAAFGGKAETAAPATAAPTVSTVEPKPSFTFDPGFTPERQPLRPWYPLGRPGPVNPTEEAELKALYQEPPWKQIEKIEDTIAEGLGKVDPAVIKVQKNIKKIGQSKTNRQKPSKRLD